MRQAKDTNASTTFVFSRSDLFDKNIDTQGRDLIIGFNEPAFRRSNDEFSAGDLDSKLNARLPSYFLPAVQIAHTQKKRPRFIIVSAIFAAAKWNAKTEEERRIMLVDNNLKVDFLRTFFERFFRDRFSIIEFRQAYDFLKISDHTLDLIWSFFEKKYRDRLTIVKQKMAQYKNPKLFASGIPSENELAEYFTKNDVELKNAFSYALVHLFVLGDINIGWDFAHNPKGYCSIGEHNEIVFNIVRDLGFEMLSEIGEIVFDQPVYAFDNMKIVILDDAKAPPAYNGAIRKSGGRQWIDEVTYENNERLSYYDQRPKLKPSMDYLYQLVDRETYERFWNEYKERYFDLKSRYKEAFQITRTF